MGLNEAQKARLQCPVCGAEMNHHAMKIDYSAGHPTTGDFAFDGTVEEIHTCPVCAHCEMRPES